MRTATLVVSVASLLAGVAALIVAGAILLERLETYEGCVDECHGGLSYGIGVLLLAILGFGLLAVGAAVLSQGVPRD